MTTALEEKYKKKAYTYTAIICGILLLLAILISWTIPSPPVPVAQDLIEINLGNYDIGDGFEQPLIKGEMSPTQEPQQQDQAIATPPSKDEAAQDVEEDDDKDAAPLVKPEKVIPTKNIPKEAVTKPVKNSTAPTAVVPAPKPQKPKFTYNGPGSGKGNGATEDNGYTSQGNNPGGKGDAGDPSGKADSYGNSPGGKSGGPKVFGNRKIVKYYSFTGDLDKATVNAIVKVSPSGTGTFMSFGKGSTTRAKAYENAIIQYLKNVQFDKSTDESTVTVQFNFNIQ